MTSPFSSSFSKNIINSQENLGIQSNVKFINNDNEVVQSTITELDYTPITSLEISNQDAKKLNAKIDNVVNESLATLRFSDEWSKNTENNYNKATIDSVSLQDLYTQDSHIIYDNKSKEIYFKDPTIGNYVSGCLTKDSDTISLSKITGDIDLIQLVDKVNTFGKVYDFQFKSTNFGEYKYANTSICSSVANALGYISFDKLINDEVIRKNKIDAKHLANPDIEPAYSGFLVSKDYIDNGWINIDQLSVNDAGFVDDSVSLSIRTKKITDAKRIALKLLLNFSSSIPELNSQNSLVDFGVRVKNTVTGQVFDSQNVKNGNTKEIGSQIILTYTGKLNYGDVSTNSSSSTTCNPCDTIIQDKCTKDIIKVANCVANESVDGIVHEIMPQIRINPLIGNKKISPEFTNTIDPIHWTTGIQNIQDYKNIYNDLIKEWGESEYIVGHLNVPRSFHYASGDASKAYVCGGFFNSAISANVSESIDNNFLNIKGWNLIGSSDVYYEIATPNGYDYNITNSFTLYYEEEWDGNFWTIKKNTVIPTPKAMGLAGGGKELEEKIIGFGVYNASFLNNGTIDKLYPTSQIWITSNEAWTHLNNANYSRVSPSGYLKSSTISSTPTVSSDLTCETPKVSPKDFFYADTNPDAFPDTTLRIDAETQLKANSAMKYLLNDTTKIISTVVSNNIGIVFNGWIGSGENSVSTGLGLPGTSNVNPFGLDKIKDSELTNIFEYMQENKIVFSAITPSDTPNSPSAASTVNSNIGWFVDTTRNYPIKTMGTLYLGDECKGVATGGKTGVSLSINDEVNSITNTIYSYFNDSKYSEFNNSIVNLAYEYNGIGWVRIDNLLENVAFHTGVGDINHQIIYGGIHSSVEKSNISISYPGCDEWESMIRTFGGTWHRKGTTGLDREKRYASFSTLQTDELNNIYYKVGDIRDLNKDGILYSKQFLDTGSIAELSGANWPSYVNAISGHITQIAYAGKNSEYNNLLDITYFIGGESWVGNSIKFEKLNGLNKILPYSERESALDDVDQVGFTTKNNLTQEDFKYTETYKPDYTSNPLSSVDGITSFPASGYYANKENFTNIVNKYKYAGHPTDGGMWLWSRPTAGENLFHPSNIHENPKYYYDSCGVKHISGSWQSYDDWIDSSFKTNIGLHTAVCWYNKPQAVTLQDSDIEKSAGYSLELETSREYRWTMGDFRVKANKLSPGGKNLACFSMDIASDRELLYNLGYINLCDLISGDSSVLTKSIAYGTNRPYLYAWDVKNSFRRVFLCKEDYPRPHYKGFINTGVSIEEIPITGLVVDISSANSVSPSGSWSTYFDYVYETLDTKSSELSGVFFKTDLITDSGVGVPIKVDYTSDFFSTNLINSEYPAYVVNPLTDLVGYDTKCFTPIDYFNRIWFVPSIPISSCCLSGCSNLGYTNFINTNPTNFVNLSSVILTNPSDSYIIDWLFDLVNNHTFINNENSLTDKLSPVPSSLCISISGVIPSIIHYYKNGIDFSDALYLNTCLSCNTSGDISGKNYNCLTEGITGEYGSTIRVGCSSLSGCNDINGECSSKNNLFLNPCGLYIPECDNCISDSISGSNKVFFHTGWFDDRSDAIYGCTKPDGFYHLTSSDVSESSCLTWWTSGCHVITHPISGGNGFYWVNGCNASYVEKGFGFYSNNFNITGCSLENISYGIKNKETYWNFELPQVREIEKIDRLREFFDTLSFGLPSSYVKPSKFTYSFYITRDGVGLDQLFYGKKRNTFVERWKFPHRDVILEALDFNEKYPHILLNDGSNSYTPLYNSSIFKYGSISVGEIEYPTSIEMPDGKIDGTNVFNSIVLMSQVQADISSSRDVNYYNQTSTSVSASCNFESLRVWLNTKEEENIKDKFSSHYYPMTFDNFNGPISGGPYFLPRGVTHQSQFSIIPTANSSAIRDRSGLWPWCDLLKGKSTNKPIVGDATWYWDLNGNIWTAETIGIENIEPKFCYDQSINSDPLHRKITTSMLESIYPSSYNRETYRIKCQDKHGNLLVDYKIIYDEVAGPEIVGSKEGFDYNIFGTSLKPRSIDLLNYNNKPLSGPTQTWVDDFDENQSVQSINWRRTQLNGSSGCPIDLYNYNNGTMCEMLSGGYYKNNIKNGVGYFCRIGSGADTWIYSAPIGKVGLTSVNENFFIQESPFAIKSISEGSINGMSTSTKDSFGYETCLTEGFPPLSAICYSVTANPLACCYIVGSSGQCLSYDESSAKYTYSPNVCKLYVSSTQNISGYDFLAKKEILDASTTPLSAIGFFSPSEIAPSGYIAPYKIIGWFGCNQSYDSYGSEIVRSIKYSNESTYGGIVSSAYITGPKSYGIGSLGMGKSTALCGSLLYSGNRSSCNYSPSDITINGIIPSDEVIGTAWPWNIIGFDGLLGPSGFTDAIDDDGNYWLAIGDINNTNPYLDVDYISFTNNEFKNFYTIIKIDASKKSEFFKTVLAKTNWKEVDSNNLLATTCLSDTYDLIKEGVNGTRLREGILETINMAEGQRYYSIYVRLIQENSTNVNSNPIILDKVNYVPETFITNLTTVEVCGSYLLPLTPLVSIPNNKVIQKLDLVSQFDINNTNCYLCDDTFTTNCPTASKWIQHNHEEWVAPYLESPFAGPYSQQGFNIWLTAGNEPRWGVSLWSSVKEGKVFANYRRQRIHVNDYREHIVLASLTATIAIDDFEMLYTSSNNISGATTHIPVYVNYDEFIYCLDDYRNAPIIKDILSKQTSTSKNGVDASDNFVTSVNNSYTGSISGDSFENSPCNIFNIELAKPINEGYVEWVSSFIQEYKSNTSDGKYYFKYNLDTNMDSNTYINNQGINGNDIVSYQWKRYQDGVGLGGDAPAFNLYNKNTEFTVTRLNQWFIGQTAIGTPNNSIVVGGYGVAGDGELHRSRCWWESPTMGVTFKWNLNVIQPEDTSNVNYKNRTLSAFWSNGDNSGANASLGVTIFNISNNTKVERQGFAKFENGILTYDVVFDEPIPDYLPNKDKYCISLVCSDNVKVWWEEKTTKGFTIKVENSFTGFVDWSIYLEDTIPGTEVDSIDEQETFEQFQDL